MIAAVVLWLTIKAWARWVMAVAFLGALKGTIGLIAGTTLSPPFGQYPRISALEEVLYLLVAGFLSYRFVAARLI